MNYYLVFTEDEMEIICLGMDFLISDHEQFLNKGSLDKEKELLDKLKSFVEAMSENKRKGAGSDSVGVDSDG